MPAFSRAGVRQTRIPSLNDPKTMIVPPTLQRALARLLLPLALCGAASWAQAQPVYKCQSQGRTVYSQDPCPGGVTVDSRPAAGAAPAKGQDTASQREAARRARMEDFMLTEADRPDVREARWAKMPAGVAGECKRLNAESAQLYMLRRDAQGTLMGEPTDAHVANRRRYRELGC